MALLSHNIYEIRKGVRKLALVTIGRLHLEAAIARIMRAGIAYRVLETTGAQVNVLLGAAECIAVIDSFAEENLSRFSPEQDFILGAFLGYDLSQQCHRYLGKRARLEVA